MRLQGRTIALDIMPAGRTRKGEKMDVSKYGSHAETAVERREQLREYTRNDVNAFYFLICNKDDESNKTGKEGAEFRRNRFFNADRVTQMKYRFCHNVGTAWIIVRVATSTIGDLCKADYDALFDTNYRVKATRAFYKVIDRLLNDGKAKIIDNGDDFVIDFWSYYIKENRNWGYGFENYLFGVSNRNTADKKDGTLAKKGIQCKCSFTLYRVSEEKDKKTGTIYSIGTNKGVSTSNGI